MVNLPRCASISILVVLLAVGCDNSPTTPTPPPPADCTFSVTPTTGSVPASGGTVAVTVTTQATCAWTATTAAQWLAASPASGTGPGTSTFTAQANTSTEARSGTVLIGGVTVTIQQAGAVLPCTFAISPTGANFEDDGGNGTITVTTTAACSWQASTGTQWLTVLTGASGTGTGTVTYKVDENTTPLARSGSVSVAGLTFRVDQSGDTSACTYQVSPVQLSICMAWTVDLVSTITTQDGCPWTASSTAAWMPITAGASGTGSGSVTVRGTDNYDAPRSGTVQVRWPTVTAGQNVTVAQAGCSYAVTQSAFTIPVGGGTGRFDVLQQADPNSCGGPLQNACVWSSVADVSWITITSPTTRTGDEAVTFTVSANTTGVARAGRITVRDKIVLITQAGS